MNRTHIFGGVVWNFSQLALMCLFALCAAPSTLRAQDHTYNNGDTNSGTLTTTANITLSITAGASTTQSGIISGTGSVTVNAVSTNTGTLTLTATNTYTGDTTIDFGTLDVDSTGVIKTPNGNVTVGKNLGDNGALTVSNGGSISDKFGYIGYIFGGTGAATVTGTNSTWHNSSDFYVGYTGSGTLTISNGGSVSDASSVIGDTSGSNGTVTVTGSNSSWSTTSDLTVGYSGTATLTISNGGLVSDDSSIIGSELLGPAGTGTVTVTGTNSTWNTTNNLYIGYSGTGTLTISNNGLVSSAITTLASNSGKGTINLESGGVLTTGQVVNGDGTVHAALNFDGGILRATGTSTNFISNFSGTEVSLLSGGGTIDNAGYNITIRAPFTGAGAATFTGRVPRFSPA